jgi:RecB family exonuclease
MRLFWLARLTQLAPEFLEAEVERRAEGTPAVTEAKGQIIVQDTGVTLVCKADRMDMNAEGAVLIYDYKTGQVPTKDQQLHYDKQLLLTAAMVTRGAFADLGPKQVADAAFLGITNELKVVRAPLADEPDTKVWDEFAALLRRWQNPHQGYTARMAVFKTDDKSWYDHLSRFGEWAESDTPEPVNLQ